jgi:hypothetical protein
MLQLIVKGNASEARAACAHNGITVSSLHEHDRFNETIIRVDGKFEHDAQTWFVASGVYDDRKPAPIGTLLWYGTIFDRTMLEHGRHGHAGLFDRYCDQCIEDGS